ncbi:hypothetical protein M514_08930 [Trichuris suis]|uniref:Uncharacterized protein n=1 Tax=Trichuris suis TaxID=68888 RepID=A0A085LYY9_9BILA|nr:hypothetical protein M513_08930 [Trichuris suis]KFD70416.1 hypothetical protein M514_08930 [Trichuris suis]
MYESSSGEAPPTEGPDTDRDRPPPLSLTRRVPVKAPSAGALSLESRQIFFAPRTSMPAAGIDSRSLTRHCSKSASPSRGTNKPIGRLQKSNNLLNDHHLKDSNGRQANGYEEPI